MSTGYGNPTDGWIILGTPTLAVSSGANLHVTRTTSCHASSGQGVVVIDNVVTAPVSLGLTTKGFMYVESGALWFMGGSGTKTCVASA